MKNNNKIICIVISIILISSLLNNAAIAGKRPKYSEHVYYSCPDWLSDTEIVYAKDISHFSYHYDWVSNIAKDVERIDNKELQICSYDINDNSEKVIKNIKINYQKLGNRRPVWEDKMFENVANQIISLSANNKKKIIIFSTRFWDRWPVFVMNYDGTSVREILDDVSGPRISPDGTKVLFSDGSGILKYIELESNKICPIVKNATYGIWDSTGSKIIYETNEKNIRNRKIMVYDLNNKNSSHFFVQSIRPETYSTDGSKIISGRSMFSADGKNLEIKNIPNYARFSPDGKHLTGAPVGVKGDICVLKTDGSGFKVLKITYSRDYD